MNAGGAAADIVAAGTLHPNTPWHVLESTREAMLQAAADQAVVPAAPPTTPKTPGPTVAMPQTAAQAAPSSPLHSLAMAAKDSRLLHEAQLQAEARGLTPPPSPPDVTQPALNQTASAVGTASATVVPALALPAGASYASQLANVVAVAQAAGEHGGEIAVAANASAVPPVRKRTASSENKAVEVAPIDSYAAGSLPLLRQIRQLVKDR